MSFWRAGPDGVTVMVKVQPRSRRPGVQGIGDSGAGPRLKIGVTEAAEDGKANRAVCALLARMLRQPLASVQIVAGAANREKLLAITGDPTSIVALLRSL
jgi:uncharacterized protein (TIGR00251 family)